MQKLQPSSLALLKILSALLILLSFPFVVAAQNAASAGVKASRPPEKGCQWKSLSSENPKFSALVEQCDFGDRKIEMQFKDSALFQKYSDAGSSAPDKIIEIFQNQAGDPPQAALKRMFIDGLNDYEKQHCLAKETKSKYEVVSPLKDSAKHAWVIMPDKQYAAKIKRETPKGDMPPDSCGSYGLPVDGRAYFEFHDSSNSQFAWVDGGQDTPLFDEQSLDF